MTIFRSMAFAFKFLASLSCPICTFTVIYYFSSLLAFCTTLINNLL